jgi:hypothetical protein
MAKFVRHDQVLWYSLLRDATSYKRKIVYGFVPGMGRKTNGFKEVEKTVIDREMDREIL